MNAVEIEQAISDLASKPSSASDFVSLFLEAFGNKGATPPRDAQKISQVRL